MRVVNHKRNAQLLLPNLSLAVTWAAKAAPTPPTPPSKYLSPPADAAVVRRGPLLFALHPHEKKRVVQTYPAALPATADKAVDYEISTNVRRGALCFATWRGEASCLAWRGQLSLAWGGGPSYKDGGRSDAGAVGIRTAARRGRRGPRL